MLIYIKLTFKYNIINVLATQIKGGYHMWTYYFDNMGRDCPVAIFQNSRNIVVLKVIETRDSHVSIPTVDFIKSFSISYYDESKLSG